MNLLSAIGMAVGAGIALTVVTATGPKPPKALGPEDNAAPGQLTIVDRTGKPLGLCPLSMTKVNADISGFGARVTLVQTFQNPTRLPIEAVYTFPLPHDAAVDRMRMKIGERIIEGEIKKRAEAKQIYDNAKNAGKVASLLDQERPNIFTQSVANIMPNAKVEIEISYVQLLKYEAGDYEFVYPMVVGPRYVNSTVVDPNKIGPPYVPKSTRAGSNIDLSVTIDAGAPITNIKSTLHEIDSTQSGNTATVTLKNKSEIPNRDFILRYSAASDTLKGALLTHFDPKKGGFFTLILMPPKTATLRQVMPRELIFVVDQSGSQSGFPIDKSKELCKKLIETARPTDTFNVLGFNTQVNRLWPESQPVTAETKAEAIGFIDQLYANGGTELGKAVEDALSRPATPERPRLVVFNTDGYVGMETQIIESIRKNRQGARVFTFGIGNSVNRYLIDAMSSEGKGDSEVVTLQSDADAAVKRFVQRTQAPILTDVSVQIDGAIGANQTLPTQIPDVFSQTPVVVYGRYTTPGKAYVRLKGMAADGPWTEDHLLDFSATGNTGTAIASLWARNQIKNLETSSFIDGFQGKSDPKALENAITDIALEYRLMSAYTSFVAVEEKVVNRNGKPETVRVPVDMPDGVTMGDGGEKVEMAKALRRSGAPGNAQYQFGGNNATLAAPSSGGGGGFGGGRGGGAAGPGGASASGKLTAGTFVKSKSADDKEIATKAPSLTRRQNFETKVDASLRKIKSGTVKVQIWLFQMNNDTLAALVKLGLKVKSKGISQPVVFGSIDASALESVAQLTGVRTVKPVKN